jgi:hypothetical protein
VVDKLTQAKVQVLSARGSTATAEDRDVAALALEGTGRLGLELAQRMGGRVGRLGPDDLQAAHALVDRLLVDAVAALSTEVIWLP